MRRAVSIGLAITALLACAPSTASAAFSMCVMVMDDRADRAEAFPEKLEAGEGGILWCASPDDPQCSPVQHDSNGAPDLGTGTARGGAQNGFGLAVPQARVEWLSPEIGEVRDGSHRRIDRPPRS